MVRQNPASKGVIAKIVFPKGLGLNAKPRRWPGLFSSLFFNCSNLGKTKMPLLADLFLGG
jgi:hypothetical protein